MNHEKESTIDVPIEGREEFVRENGMALLADRDGKIERQRARIKQLEDVVTGQRRTINQLLTSCPFRRTLQQIAEADPNEPGLLSRVQAIAQATLHKHDLPQTGY